jgi:hypothetical protein
MECVVRVVAGCDQQPLELWGASTRVWARPSGYRRARSPSLGRRDGRTEIVDYTVTRCSCRTPRDTSRASVCEGRPAPGSASYSAHSRGAGAFAWMKPSTAERVWEFVMALVLLRLAGQLRRNTTAPRAWSHRFASVGRGEVRPTAVARYAGSFGSGTREASSSLTYAPGASGSEPSERCGGPCSSFAGRSPLVRSALAISSSTWLSRSP